MAEGIGAIDNFIGSLAKGGQRSNLFDVIISGGTGSPFSDEGLIFKAKASSVPTEQIGVIEVPYFGRTFKVAGDRTYDEWTITVIAEEGMELRGKFESWLQQINDPVTNETTVEKPEDYLAMADVKLYTKNNSLSSHYKIHGIWPSSIGEMSLAWDSNDEIAEFEVTLQVQYVTRIDIPNTVA